MTQKDKKIKEEEKRGPKPKVDYWLTEDGQTLLTGWARQGLSNLQIAKNMGIVQSTFYVWKNEHPEITEAIQKGKEVIDFEVENALLTRAMGQEVIEEKTYMKDDGTGRMVKHKERVKKQLPSDATSMIFWLKNRQPDRWSDRKHMQHSGNIDSNITAFDSVSTEDLQEIVKQYKEVSNEDEE